MITVNVAKAKTHLSHYLSLVQQGQTVTIAKRNTPIAKLKPAKQAKPKQRKIGGLYKFKLNKEFFDPLPDDILEAFNNPK